MTILFTNNASGTLSVEVDGDTPGPESLALSLQSNEASLFPFVTTASGNIFYATLEDSAGNIEIVKVTNNDTVNDVLTIERAQENTTSQDFAVGSRVECRPTAASLSEFLQKSGGTMTGAVDFDGNTLQDPVITNTGVAAIKGVPIRGGDNGTGNEFVVPVDGGDPTIGANIVTHSGNDSAYVKNTRSVIAGQGITGGGTLADDRTFSLDVNSLAQINGNAITEGDAFLVHDGDVNQHKRVLYENGGVPIITESSNARTADTVDLNKYIRFTGTGTGDPATITYTLDDNVGVTGNVIIIEQANTGQVTIAGSATVNSAFTLSTRVQNSVAVLLCVQGGASAVWTLYGDLAE